MQAELCGFALAVAPNEACYVPLGHRQGGEGDDGTLFRGDVVPDQIPEGDALEALKPLLTDAGVLKIGRGFQVRLAGLRAAAASRSLLTTTPS